MFEFFEHTADLGIRVRAESRLALFTEAARALTALLLENPGDALPAETRALHVGADDELDLFHDWLDELLFHFNARHFIFVQFELTLEDNIISGMGWGEPLDPARHRANLDVKAITYHRLQIEERHGEWLAQFIVDI